ncbi:hypothetical protein [Spiroplasma taiwanense]|uniref:Uncharacterized protein n=1 Tax=Spiroplasma taiwanense CT-1 TaxID=1276220 RepID=S5LZG2_9MOLU|nr:hypothetical protein [Spiroplasma taiwanense]AGR41097.1 hypothetical protein STAIW_v1c04510 [Spiroplasma taiwanense CT-1]
MFTEKENLLNRVKKDIKKKVLQKFKELEPIFDEDTLKITQILFNKTNEDQTIETIWTFSGKNNSNLAVFQDREKIINLNLTDLE